MENKKNAENKGLQTPPPFEPGTDYSDDEPAELKNYGEYSHQDIPVEMINYEPKKYNNHAPKKYGRGKKMKNKSKPGK